MNTFEQLDFVPLSTGDATERRFDQSVQNTQRAVSQAVLRYVPGAILPEAAATAVLPDGTFDQLCGPVTPDIGVTRAVYFAGSNIVTVPQEFSR